MKKQTRYYVLIHGTQEETQAGEYAGVSGPFKNVTAAEWWVEHELPAGTTVTVKQVVKV